jgi:predicted AlkP superfamily pyrophosphatase or phosphodiesterase
MGGRPGTRETGRRRAGVFAVLGAVVALASSCREARPSRPSPQPSTTSPRLVLVVVVDQMRFDYLTRFRTLFTGGLRSLLERGAVFANAHCAYANSETAPGHAVVLTGLLPAHSGIVANAWYDAALRRRVGAVEDPDSVTFGGSGRWVSPRNMLGPTLAEALKRAKPSSRVVGVSGKDRGAVLLAGRGADAAYWMDPSTGQFTTSTHYMRQLPPWLAAERQRTRVDRYASASWTRLLPDVALYRRLAGEDAVVGEATDGVFPHRLPSRTPEPAFVDALRRTPFADEMVVDVALQALDAHGLGEDEHTDILSVSLSATDAIGHAFGPDSQEMMDQILRVDRALQRLLAEVDRRVGAQRTLVVLAADHGIMPLVEILKRQGLDARRVKPAVIQTAVRDALAARFPGSHDLVALYDGPDVYLDLPALGAQHLRRSEVENVVRRALVATGQIEAVYTQAELQGPRPSNDPYFDLYRNSFFAPRSPHLIGRLKPYIYLNERSTGTGHGTPQECDRHVPIVFLGAGIRPGERREPCGPQDIAPTLARWLGIPYPGVDGRPLSLGGRDSAR